MTQIKTVTAPYDVAEHLRTAAEMAAYLEASIEEVDGNTTFIAKALCDIARAKGLSQVTKELGLSYEGWNESLSEEHSLTLDTVLKAISALGLKLSIEAVATTSVAAQ
ncbi:MAG: putative addiction module antidote protein [Phormidesmis priestleyi]|uniref:Putative addiction module antidote protein n=1 Tax=Phormidesmis priestleyi TaxID=268141 RepID=A0A2W4X7M0_9CYAN|nr:MAG: putative addiction module antidote protein [Phormidesmis priestleyi]